MAALPKLTDATLELDARVATLTLNRDDVRNALTGSVFRSATTSKPCEFKGR